MAKQGGAYFKDKAEAVEFYRNSEENLKDKPDWMIECIIDFAIQYPNYKEYVECEARVKAGEELTAKQKKKYGSLKWEATHNTYTKDELIPDSVDIMEAGTYDNIALDPVAREKLNKYGLEFPETLPPSDHVQFKVMQPDGTEAVGTSTDGVKWDVKS